MKIQTKQQAKLAFGTYAELAEWLGIDRSVITRWPDKLEQKHIDRVKGALIRKRKQAILDLNNIIEDE